MTIKIPKYIKSDFYGLKSIAKIWHKAKNAFLEEVILDFSGCMWFEANLAALLGGIIDKIEQNLNNVELINIPDKLQNVLQRNEFLYTQHGENANNFS